MRLVVVHPAAHPADAARAVALADLLEIRLDLDGPVVEGQEGRRPDGFLATIRSAEEGGGKRLDPPEFARRLLPWAKRGAAFIDAERDVVPLVTAEARPLGTRVLASLHGTRPIDLPKEGVDAWKIARPVSDGPSMRAALAEARELARGFLEGRNPAAFVVPYGPFSGLRGVTAAVAEGSGIDAFVFGRPDRLDPSLEGSLSGVPILSELVDDLRLGEISGSARLFGLVGRPPARSPSPRLHNAVFRALGLDALYLPEADLDAEAALALPYDGWSVTTPLKESVAALCDDLEPLARRIGAVNTVVRDEAGRLIGSNTDGEAVADAVRRQGIERGGALVFGGGGFARAAAVALKNAGLDVRIAGRERARVAADALGLRYVGPDALRGSFDRVLVNATPLGADGGRDASLDELARGAGPGVFAIDATYGPDGRVGTFGLACEALGAEVLTGPDLLCRQAIGQARRFTGRDVEPRVIGCAMGARRGNLVLVGPRGAGKTSVGRLVARRLGRPFVDVDEEIARRAGRPAGRVLEERGAAAFRELEGREVARALARTGAVVSLGGGALEAEGAVDRARGRGFVVRLAVSPAEAARRVERDPTPRPRLTDEPTLAAECERVLREREPRYAAAAHATVATDGRAIEAIASDVIDRWTRSDFGRRA